MVLKKYILKRFFKYIFTINISITFLFNFIEFFEKIVRVKHATLGTVFHFISLNLPPSFFENLNISCWLATCLILKEFIEQNEWETFKILNVNYKKLFKLFLFAGTITATITFIGKETITLPLLNKSEKYKFEKLKQISTQKIHNKWLELKNSKKESFKKFSFFQYLNLKTLIGNSLILIDINKNFEMEKIISTPEFKVNLQTKEILLNKATKIEIKENSQSIKHNYKLYLPSFFSQLQLSNYIPKLNHLLKNIIFDKLFLPQNVWLDLIAEMLKRLLFYLQILLYPILTLIFFLIFEDNKKYKWISIFLPYPIMRLSALISNFFANNNFNPIFMLLPYILIILFIIYYVAGINIRAESRRN
jgi:lipopolysaccharide export LptBFGC system permease protein LptF